MPRTTPSRLVALAALAVTAALVLGCSSAHPPAPATPAVTPTPVTTVVSPGTLKSYRYTIALTVAGGVLGDAAGAASASSADPTPAAAATPASDSSFTIDVNGEVVNPDRERTQTKASLGFIQLSVERIEIAGSAWTREAGGTWKRATPGTAPDATLGANLDISPARLFAPGGATFASLNEQLAKLPSTEDSVNGIKARRYDLSASEFRALFSGAQALLPGGGEPVQTTGSLWIAENTSVPVRVRLASTTANGQPAFQMDMQLKDLNAPIDISPPA